MIQDLKSESQAGPEHSLHFRGMKAILHLLGLKNTCHVGPCTVKAGQLEQCCCCHVQHTPGVASYHILEVGLHFIDCCFQAFDPQPSTLLSHFLSRFLPPHFSFFLTPIPAIHSSLLFTPPFFQLLHCWECQVCNPADDLSGKS